MYRYSQVLRKVVVIAAVLTASCCLVSCKKKEEAPAPANVAAALDRSAAATGEGPGAPKGDSAPQEKKRKVILNHSITLEVKELPASLEALSKLAESNGGYVFKSNSYSQEENERWGEVGLRVPANKAGSVLARVKELGKVDSENSTAEDITEGYVDLEARLKNAKSSEARLAELFRKAGKLSDVLEIEKELTRVRGDIEAFDAKKKNWDLLTEMVTIEVRLNEGPKGFPSFSRVWSPIKTAFGKSVVALAESLHSLIIFSGAAIPWLAVVGPVAYLYVRRRRKSQPGTIPPAMKSKAVSEEDEADLLP